jgi:hypothetical protein
MKHVQRVELILTCTIVAAFVLSLAALVVAVVD